MCVSRFCFQIWQKNRKLRTVDLKTNELHDKVYEPDGKLGVYDQCRPPIALTTLIPICRVLQGNSGNN